MDNNINNNNNNTISIDYPGNKRDSEFFEIGNICGSDKFYRHHYYNFYPKFIEYYKIFSNIAMLEIGIDQKCSLNLWLNYFPNAFVYGIDINISDEGDMYKIFKADQSQTDDLHNIMHQITKPLFLIVDDGSHIPEHQILSFNLLFELLLPGGTYIIEDIELSYWIRNHVSSDYKINYGYHHKQSLVEFFKLVVDDINSLFLTEENKRKQTEIIEHKLSQKTRQNISTITFTHNTIIITKKTEEELKYRSTDYIWKTYL